MEKIFIDTGFLIALETSDDQHHDSARNCWKNLILSKPSLFTTSYIVDEVATFFNSRNRHSKAIEIGNCLLSSASVTFIHVDKHLFFKGWEYFKRCDDKSYSLTDCISFVIMEKFEIWKSLSFDKHFEQAGFAKLPE